MKKDVKKTDALGVSELVRDYFISVTKKIAEKIPPRVKTLVMTGIVTLFSHADAANPTALGVPESSKDESSTEISKTSMAEAEAAYNATLDFDKAAAKLSLKSGGIYKGLKLNFTDMEAPDLGHIFESGLNPYIMGGKGKYLGLYQMETTHTVKNFLFGTKKDGQVIFAGVAKDYPQLAVLGKTAEGRRSRPFVKMFGDLSKTPEFRHKMDNYMEVTQYQPVYEALSTIPGLDYDKRGDVFKATIMTATNQNPNPSVIKDIYEKALELANSRAEKAKRQTTTADIISASYEVRTKRWGLAERYKEEKRLALDWLKFEEKMSNLKLIKDKKQEKYAATIEVDNALMPFNPVSNLNNEIDTPKPLAMVDVAQKKIIQRHRSGR